MEGRVERALANAKAALKMPTISDNDAAEQLRMEVQRRKERVRDHGVLSYLVRTIITTVCVCVARRQNKQTWTLNLETFLAPDSAVTKRKQGIPP